MPELEARALGAGAAFVVGESEYRLSPIKLQALAELQRAALRYYKTEYLETYKTNIDMFPQERREALLEKKLDEVARWDIEDLPAKKSYSADGIPVTSELKARIDEIFNDEPGRTDETFLRLLVVALNSAQISPAEIKKLTGRVPLTLQIAYDMWWVSGCVEGMISLLYESLRPNHHRVKRSDIASWPLSVIAQASAIVEEITAPDAGNT